MKIAINKLYKTPVVITGVLFLLFGIPKNIFCQAMDENDFQKSIHFFDNNGKLFVNPNIDVAGTPFFMDSWKTGKIKVGSNSIFNGYRIRLNLYSQEVHFLKSDNVEMTAPAGTVPEIFIDDTIGSTIVTHIFICGYPSIDNQSTKNFYEVLSDGKIQLLKSMRKMIHQDKDDFSGAVQKEFREYDDYYFYQNGNMIRLKKDKDIVLGLMKDKSAAMDDYVKKNKNAFKSIDDIKRLVDYYNAL